MAFPFLYLTLSLITGILLSSRIGASPSTWALGTVATLIACWFTFSILKKTRGAFFLCLLTTLLLGAALTASHDQDYRKNPLRGLRTQDYIGFTGRLVRSPSFGRDRDYLMMKVEEVEKESRNIPVSGRLRVSVIRSPESGKHLSDLLAGDRIRASAKLTPEPGYRNFSASPLEKALRSQTIHRRAFAKSPLLIQVQEPGRFSPGRWFSLLRRNLQKAIASHFGSSDTLELSREGAVLEALLLGERRRMDHGLTRSLQEAGIFHLFAISGAHIAIISFLLFSVFRLFRLKEGLRYIFLIVFLVHYALLVEGRPSVMRATVMALAYMVGKLLWRNVHLLNTLSFSAFFLLLFNPVSLFSLGFQLTFAATLSIILFFPRVMSHLPRLPLRISEIFALSLTAQAGVLPFILLAFNRVTFASLVLNFVAIPLVGLIMAFGAIFLLLSVTYAPLAGLLSQGLGAGVRALIATTEILDPFPWLSLRVPTPKLSLVLLYFLLLGSFLLPRALRKIKPLSGIGFLVVLVLLVTSPFPSRSDNLKVTFLDVGQGDSVLVEFPGKKKMLVDGGGVPGDTFDVGEYVVSPFLWRKGIKKIDYLVLTHAHPDHLNGLKAVARNFRIGEFWEALSPSESPSYSELKRLLPATTIRRRLFRGGGFSTDGVTIQVLNPEEGPHSVPHVHNDQSLVLRIVYGKTSILLAGDIGWKAEKDLVEAGLPLRSWVLKSPHHGSDSSSSEIFMNAVAPKIVVISVGAGNRYGFPDSVVLDRYARWGAQVYRTDTDGAVEIRSDGSDVGVRTASSRHAPKGPLFPETRRAAVD